MKNFITRKYTTETGHRLTDYAGKCAHLHGHSYKWEVTITGPLKNAHSHLVGDEEFTELLPNGMLLDFADLKEIIKEVIEPWDHAFLFHDKDPIIQAINLSSRFTGTDGTAARVFVYPWNPTAENMSIYVYQTLQEVLTREFVEGDLRLQYYVHSVKVQETETSFAECTGW